MNRRRIIFTALVGTIALAALSVSISLAWYGASDRLGVSNLDVHVYTGANLQISTSDDPESFDDALDMKDFDEKYQSMLLSPTSSMFQGNWFDSNAAIADRATKPTFYDIYSDNLLISGDGDPRINESYTGFFSEDIYFLTNFSQYVSLEVDTTKEEGYSVFANNEAANRLRAQDLYSKYGQAWGMSEDEILERLNGLINSLRVSILVLDDNQYSYYIIDPTKKADQKTLYGGVLDSNGDGYYDTYRAETDDGRVDTEIVYGEVNDRSLISYDFYSVQPSSDSSDNPVSDNLDVRDHIFFGNSFEANHKNGSRIYNAAKSESEGFEIVEENSISLDDIQNDDNSLLIPCYAHKPSHVVLSIYLEGWDLDCINATMGASFDITLNFKLLRGI